MALHNTLGKEGERAVFRYLEEHRYRILEQNWRYNKWELDLVATDGRYIIIVEVKTRNADTNQHPLLSVTPSKQNLLCRAADAYVRTKGYEQPVRFDIITAIYVPSQGIFEIEHFPDAFRVRPRRGYRR